MHKTEKQNQMCNKKYIRNKYTVYIIGIATRAGYILVHNKRTKRSSEKGLVFIMPKWGIQNSSYLKW